MKRCAPWIVATWLSLPATTQALPSFSTGGVSSYSACLGGSTAADIPNRIPQARQVAQIFASTGFGPMVSRWENGNVWEGDFIDGSDLDPNGGSDAPNIYFYARHRTCEAPPGNATDGDFVTLCPNDNGNVLAFDNIGNGSRWGNSGGHAQFILLDASCPMD